MLGAETNLLQNRPRIVAACRQTAATFCKTKECGSLPRGRCPPREFFYNTKAEVDRFVEVVKEIQTFFGQ
jgi:hypothetical protein